MYPLLIISLFLVAFGADFWEGPQRAIAPSEIETGQIGAYARNYEQFSQAAERYVEDNKAAMGLVSSTVCGGSELAATNYSGCPLTPIDATSLTPYLPINYVPMMTWSAWMQGSALIIGLLPTNVSLNAPRDFTYRMMGIVINDNNGNPGIGIVKNNLLYQGIPQQGSVSTIPMTLPDNSFAQIRLIGSNP